MSDLAPNWKSRVLADFEQWLAAIPDTAPESRAQGPSPTDAPSTPGPSAPTPSADLHSLVAAFLALRQEVRLQSREQARAARDLERAIGVCEAASEGFREGAASLAEREDRARRKSERHCAEQFLDVYDALRRGRDAAAAVARRRFWHRPAAISEVERGYELALGRCERALGAIGATRVPAEGPFDPRTMVALGVRTVPGLADEWVIEESRAGFAQGDDIIRTAEVIVNRTG